MTKNSLVVIYIVIWRRGYVIQESENILHGNQIILFGIMQTPPFVKQMEKTIDPIGSLINGIGEALVDMR